MTENYRRCVGMMILNEKNEILVGKRIDHPSGHWQMPQGGIDENEDPEQAVWREMKEEIGCDQFQVVTRTSELLRYDFPKEATFSLTKTYLGQDQRWFLCQFYKDQAPSLKKASSPEFQDLAWVSTDFVLQEVVSWKRDLYRKGLSLLGLKKKP